MTLKNNPLNANEKSRRTNTSGCTFFFIHLVQRVKKPTNVGESLLLFLALSAYAQTWVRVRTGLETPSLPPYFHETSQLTANNLQQT